MAQKNLQTIELSNETKAFLKTKKSRNTVYSYRVGFRRFLEYYRAKHGEGAIQHLFLGFQET